MILLTISSSYKSIILLSSLLIAIYTELYLIGIIYLTFSSILLLSLFFLLHKKQNKIIENIGSQEALKAYEMAFGKTNPSEFRFNGFSLFISFFVQGFIIYNLAVLIKLIIK